MRCWPSSKSDCGFEPPSVLPARGASLDAIVVEAARGAGQDTGPAWLAFWPRAGACRGARRMDDANLLWPCARRARGGSWDRAGPGAPFPVGCCCHGATWRPKNRDQRIRGDHSGVRQAMMPMHVELMLCIPLIDLKTPSGGAFFLAKRRRL